ncbi:MAG: DUF4258 domain-containing protein [Acidobacteria bacterium]|nr:DUF4258 domain-containing protein [Acidobacteriota bacterium]
MAEAQWSTHAKTMLEERRIQEEWAMRTIQNPDRYEESEDGNGHYIKSIPEHGGRFLRVVVNPSVSPKRILTVFLIGVWGGSYEAKNQQGKRYPLFPFG